MVSERFPVGPRWVLARHAGRAAVDTAERRTSELIMRKKLSLHIGMLSILVGGLLLRPERAAADPAVTSISPVQAFDASGRPAGDPVGSSRLVRDDTGLSFEITTSRLAPLNIYTVWWMVTRPNGQLLFMGNGGGGLALPNGSASFAGHLPVGPLPAADGKTVIVAAPGTVLDDPRRVTVTFVIREHGPIVLDRLAEQLTTINGGSPPNTCRDVQTASHAP
jgi:hypothetical protein